MSGTDNGMVQVSARDLQAQRRMLELFDKVWNSPDVGAQVRKKAKEFDPTIAIPDEHPIVVQALEQRNAIEAKVTGLEAAFNEYRAAAEQKDAETRLRKQLGDVQEKFGFTADGMSKVIEVMQERQLADPEAAALVYRESLPKPTPQGNSNRLFTDNKIDLFGTTKQDEAWEKLHTNPDAFFTETVNEVLTEMPVG